MHAQNHQPEVAPGDWNFDSIPDHHLIACCHWEYARESSFLRAFKSRCVEANRNPKPLAEAFQLVGKDARRVLSIGPVANSFLLGFGLGAPTSDAEVTRRREPGEGASASDTPISGLFPAPWQSLSTAERDYRAQLAAGAFPPDPQPFQSVSGADAVNALMFMTDTVVSSLSPLPDALYTQVLQNQLDRLNSLANPQVPIRPPTAPPSTLHAPRPLPPLVPTLLRLDTHSQLADEIVLVQIQWGTSTDDQILDSFRAWVKANRPANVRPTAARGHKLKDWRAHLTRLAVMRLLTRFSALDLVDPTINKLPAIWATKQFSGPTWLDVVKWHDARREARQTFHLLFPFLAPNDPPPLLAHRTRPPSLTPL
jgi:hypothetical protein